MGLGLGVIFSAVTFFCVGKSSRTINHTTPKDN